MAQKLIIQSSQINQKKKITSLIKNYENELFFADEDDFIGLIKL